MILVPDTLKLDFSDDERRLWKETLKLSEETSCIDDVLLWERVSSGKQTGLGDECFQSLALLNQEKRVRKGYLKFDIKLHNGLYDALCKLYPQNEFTIPEAYRKFKRLRLCHTVFGSELWNRGKEKYILARWLDQVGNCEVTRLWPGIVKYYIEFDLRLDGTLIKTHRFAVCSWFKAIIPSSNIYDSVWSTNFHVPSTDNFIPIARIAGAFVPATTGQGFQCLILPNQLTEWNPSDEFAEFADDVDDTVEDIDVDLTLC